MRFIKNFFKFIFGLILALVIIGAVGYFILLPRFEQKYEAEVFGNQDAINYLLIGKESPMTLADHDAQGPAHSDTLMVATIYPKTNKVKLTSIPRDTYMKYLPNSKKKNQKINAAFFLGGAQETIDVVEDFLDIKIDKYMVIDYNAVIQIVNAVGGIDINWEYDDYHYEDNWTVPPLVIDFKHGINHLDGEKAVSYLRTRKAYKNQDLDRMKAQQQFLVKLYEKLKDPKNIFLVPELLDIIENNTETNLTKEDMIYLAYYAFKNIDMNNIQVNTLEGYNKRIAGTDYYVVDKEKAREMIHSEE